MENVDYLDNLKPGKRKMLFILNRKFLTMKKAGVQSSKSKKIYIYVWDPEQKEYVGKVVDQN